MANEKSTTCSRSFKLDESFRSFVNVFTAMCLIACIISQVYIYHKFTRMDERIDNLGNIVEKIVVESPIQIKQPWMKTMSCGKEGPYNKGPLICKVWLSV